MFKTFANKYFLIILIFISQLVCAQIQFGVPWPFRDINGDAIRGKVSGTPGEFRTSGGGRFHGGVDCTNGGDYSVYAMNAGIIQISAPGNNCWNAWVRVEGPAYDIVYKHIKPAGSNPVENGEWVNVGDYLGEMFASPGGCWLHLHINESGVDPVGNPLQGGGTNYINNHLNPFNDTNVPIFLDPSNLSHNGVELTQDNSNAIEIWENGRTRTNNSQEMDTEYTINNTQYRLVYDKIDMSARIIDYAIESNGGGNDGKNAPNSIRYQIYYDTPPPFSNYDNTYTEFINFNTIPNNNQAQYIFDSRANCCSDGSGNSLTRHYYIITNHAHQQPYDRYWHARLKKKVVDTWNYDANNNANNFVDEDYENLEAKINEDAKYPDDTYIVRVSTFDIANFENTQQNESVQHHAPVIVDNFRPYITYLEVREGTGEIAPLIYQGQWDWDGTNLQLGPFSNPIANKIPPHTDGNHDLEIFLKTSEYVENLIVDIFDAIGGSYNSSFSTSYNPEKTEWTITIPAGAILSNAFGDQTIHVTAQDRAGNDLLGFNTQYTYTANQLPHRVGSGSTYTTANWSVAFPATTDQIHIFEISDCIYNEGDNKKSSNNCLADFTATTFYPNQSSSFCNNSSAIPYIHPVEGGFSIRPSSTGKIYLDATASQGANSSADYEWFFYPSEVGEPTVFGSGENINVYWTTPGDKVIELRIQCDGACSTKRINVSVAESPCNETKTPVFEPDQLASTDIVASFLHPSACEYIGQPNCPNSANFNNGEIITNPDYFGASGCYELDVFKVVPGVDIPIIQDEYKTDFYTIECLEAGDYRVVMKDNVSACTIEQLIVLKDQNPIIAFDITPEYISACGGSNVLGSVSAYITEPSGCFNNVEVSDGSQRGDVIELESEPGGKTYAVDVYLDEITSNVYTTASITIPQETVEDNELAITFTVQAANNGCNGSIQLSVSGGSGDYGYSLNQGGSSTNSSFNGLCIGTYQIDITDRVTGCTASTTIQVSGQVGTPTNPDIITHIGITPNPFNDSVDFGITLSEIAHGDNSAIPVTISIYDTNGSHVATHFQGSLAPNSTHSMTIDMSSYASGTYIFTAQTYNQGESLMGIKN